MIFRSIVCIALGATLAFAAPSHTVNVEAVSGSTSATDATLKIQHFLRARAGIVDTCVSKNGKQSTFIGSFESRFNEFSRGVETRASRVSNEAVGTCIAEQFSSVIIPIQFGAPFVVTWNTSLRQQTAQPSSTRDEPPPTVNVVPTTKEQAQATAKQISCFNGNTFINASLSERTERPPKIRVAYEIPGIGYRMIDRRHIRSCILENILRECYRTAPDAGEVVIELALTTAMTKEDKYGNVVSERRADIAHASMKTSDCHKINRDRLQSKLFVDGEEQWARFVENLLVSFSYELKK